MADFRKWFLAFAVVALLLGTGVSANAQTTPFACTAQATSTPLIRAEGITELVGDVLITCTGGTPTTNGAVILATNVQIFLPGQITSRILDSNGFTEAILAIDEPFPFAVASGTAPPYPGAIPSSGPISFGAPGATPGTTATNVQQLCNSGAQGWNANNLTCNLLTGTGNGQAVYTGTGTPPRPNIFQGRVVPGQPQTLQFNGVPIDPPGTAGTRSIRITNVRMNASAIGAGGAVPIPVVMTISVNGSQAVTLTNPQPIVAYARQGLLAGTTPVNLSSCTGNGNQSLSVTFTEGFPTAFKRRNVQPVATAADQVGPAPLPQNVLGANYNYSESGFYNPTLNTVLGLADTGTRIIVRFNNVPAGVAVTVPVLVPLNIAGTGVQTTNIPLPPASPAISGLTSGYLRLVNTDANGANTGAGGGFSGPAVPGSGRVTIASSGANSGFAVYEVIMSDPNATESATITASPQFSAVTGQSGIQGIQATASVSFAPISNVFVASSVDPIPRFIDSNITGNAFIINPCFCNLLFPFVTNLGGFETGIAVANTSLDTGTGFVPGALAQSGTVTFNFYNSAAGGTPVVLPRAISGVVPAGGLLAFGLTNGGASANYGATTMAAVAAGSFNGYVIAQAGFQYCHGFALISQFGNPFSGQTGYTALQMDNKTIYRTGNNGESLDN